MRRSALVGAPDEVARRLLGARLVGDDGVVLRLVDVEAYGGADDPASHAYRGERPRNRSMFLGPGHLYVYVSHGIHCCANVVVGPRGTPTAVLLRGGVVERGVDVVESRRGRRLIEGHLDGPGRLCQGLGITLADDGLDLLDPGARVRLRSGTPPSPESVREGPRIGLTKEAERPWRFHVTPARLRP